MVLKPTEETITDSFTGRVEHYIFEPRSSEAFFFDPEDPKTRRDALRMAGKAARSATQKRVEDIRLSGR